MFGIDTTELLIIAVVALIVIGPKDLPRVDAHGRQLGRPGARHGAPFPAGVETMMREAELEEMEKKWREENERIMREYPPGADYPDPAAAAALAADATPSLPLDDADPRPPAERPLP